jgi:transaldolase
LDFGGFKVKTVSGLKIKFFGDGADMGTILELYKNPLIKGFTTNPTLMRKAGIKNYERFAREILDAVPDRPISFEVFSDDNWNFPNVDFDSMNVSFDTMYAQAKQIAAWSENIYVKIPITNTRGGGSYHLINTLSGEGIKVNVTAVMTVDQVREACRALRGGAPAYVSVFAGRIADTGRDPVPYMQTALDIIERISPDVELIWASPRELLNIFQADAVGCHIITATNDILKKLSLVGKDLTDYSLETVQMFYNDAKASGFTL